MLPGQVIAHGTIFTLKVQEPVCPEPSVALQVTWVVPTWNVEPELGVHVATTVSQLSVAVGGG